MHPLQRTGGMSRVARVSTYKMNSKPFTTAIHIAENAWPKTQGM